MQEIIDLSLQFAKYAAVGGAGLMVLRGTIFTVEQQTEALVSRFNKYTGTPRRPGLNFKIPLVDKVDARISTALKKIDAKLATKTKDEQFVDLPISIQLEITDTAKYYYDTTKPNEQISNIVSAEVRKYANEKDFAELYSDREEISRQVIKSVISEMGDYGVQLRRIVIDEPQPDKSTVEAYNDVKASERRRDAAKNNADAERILMVGRAQADKERNELVGLGIKAFRKSIAESYIETRQALIDAGVDPKSADAFMAEAMRLDTMRDVGEKGNLIVMALEGSGQNKDVFPQVLAALKAQEQNNAPGANVSVGPAAPSA